MNRKIAVAWCRVSTGGQRELSLESQEIEVKRALEARGYEVPPQYVIKVDWTSLDLMSCPEFQEVRRLIADGAVDAFGTLDRDRLQAQGLQRLTFLAECAERGVDVITAQGSPMLEGGEGQLVELALALGKERSVLRAQQGARDGLRNRAMLKGLPPSPVDFFGYRWDKERNRYVPTERYMDAREVWRMALAKTPINRIASELTRRGIATPGGRHQWSPRSVRHILANSSYTGVIEALKTEMIEPKRRAGNTYGKTSKRAREIDARIRLEGLVERPIVSQLEFEWMQKRLRDNQQFALKKTRLRSYLLSGKIRCSSCGRSYVGTTSRRRNSTYSYYVCGGRFKPSPGNERCLSPNLNVDSIETAVFGMVSKFLSGPDGFENEMRRKDGISEESEVSLRKELENLLKQDRHERDAEARALQLAAHATISEDAFEEAIGLIRTKRKWIIEQRSHLEEQLHDLERYRFDPDALELMRERMASRLTSATVEDRLFVLEAVGARVVVQEDGKWELELQVPRRDPEPPVNSLQIVNGAPSGAPTKISAQVATQLISGYELA